jgi:Helix-turn-helix domain
LRKSSLGTTGPIFLTLEEVVERYRAQVSEGTLRNWRSMRIGPSFIKIGKAILYPLEELDRWDRRNLVVCRPSRSLPPEEATE